MTTKKSPKRVLKQQADKIAATLKAAERGDKIDAKFAAKIAEARTKPMFKTGIAMDDKIITIEMPWETIRNTTTAGLSQYIMDQMREVRRSVN